MNRPYSINLLLINVLILAACSGSSEDHHERVHEQVQEVQTRSFALGFTPWPYDASIDAVNFVYSEINDRGGYYCPPLG